MNLGLFGGVLSKKYLALIRQAKVQADRAKQRHLGHLGLYLCISYNVHKGSISFPIQLVLWFLQDQSMLSC